jgi:hypothetical protein
MSSKIVRPLSIVVETSPNSDRANFPRKSKAENFLGLALGKQNRFVVLIKSESELAEIDGVWILQSALSWI